MNVVFNLRLGLPSNGTITFSQWLPNDENDRLCVTDDDITLEITFPEELAFMGMGISGSVENNLNIWIDTIAVKAIVEAVPGDVVEFMKLSPRDQFRESGNATGANFIVIAKRLFVTICKFINRLIDYVRVNFQQYYLEKLSDRAEDMNIFFRNTQAKVFIDGKKYDFYPQTNVPVTIHVSDGKEYIRSTDWGDLKAFVSGGGRSSLLGLMLANARQLQSKGHNRSAIIESVTALEVAISGYCDKKKNEAISDAIGTRIEQKNLKSLVEKLGLRGALSIVFPIIFDEHTISNQTFVDCRTAVDLRNNVIHNGRRDVEKGLLIKYLSAIERCCYAIGENWDSTAHRFQTVKSIGLNTK